MSNINTAQPQDGALVGKAAMRANFRAAATEIDAVTPGTSVLDYGADRTGTSDATAAFASAVANAVTDETYTVLVPPGEYLANLDVPNNVSLWGIPNRSIIRPAIATDPIIKYDTVPPYGAFSRPFIRGLILRGTRDGNDNAQAVGILSEDHATGLDMADINIADCTIGIDNAGTFGGQWNTLTVDSCDVGLKFRVGAGGTSPHVGNKRIFNLTMHYNGTAVFIEHKTHRTAIIGGTIEDNGRGVVIADPNSSEPYHKHPNLWLEHVWLENNDDGDLPGLTLADATVVPVSNIYVYQGALVAMNSQTIFSDNYIGDDGELYAEYGSFESATLTSTGLFRYRRCSVPVAFEGPPYDELA